MFLTDEPIDFLEADLKLFKETFTDEGLRKRLIKVFLEEFPPKLDELKNCFYNGDIERFRFLVHCVKGMLGNMRFLHLAEELKNINDMANLGNLPDSNRLEEILFKLYTLLDHLHEYSEHLALKS